MSGNKSLKSMVQELSTLAVDRMYLSDFFHTWKASLDELQAVFTTATLLAHMRQNNISTKIFESGLGISIFRDNSTRTRFSFASACNMLGLGVQDLDESSSQIAHGETVRETANMISFMAETIGIRDDMYIEKGHLYMKEVADAVAQGYQEGVLPQRPSVVNLQCDIDHPSQTLADALHLINHFGGIENLKGKKVAMSWAYSPSYGKPLSVPQGIIGLLTRFGMDVVLAHPEGYEVIGEVETIAKEQAKASGGSYQKVGSMQEAFKDADVVYTDSWMSYHIPKEEEAVRIKLFTPYQVTGELMRHAKPDAIFMNCLPAMRGYEQTAEVIDGPQSVVFDEAENRLHAQKAVMLTLCGKA